MRTFPKVVPALGLLEWLRMEVCPCSKNLWESRKLHEVHGIWIGYKSASPLHVYGSLHICDYPYE